MKCPAEPARGGVSYFSVQQAFAKGGGKAPQETRQRLSALHQRLFAEVLLMSGHDATAPPTGASRSWPLG